MANNPRSRDRTAQSSVMTPATRLPAIPTLRDPGKNPDLSVFGREAYQFAAATKQILDTRLAAANKFERWVTLRDINDLGLAGGTAKTEAPSDAIGIPMWTSRGKHDLVTLAGLATALADFLDASTNAGTKNAAPAPAPAAASTGVSADELASQLRALEQKLRQAWASDITDALKSSNAQVEDVASQLPQLWSAMQRNFMGFVYVRTTLASVWSIPHNMKKYPQVTVLNTSHEVVYADVVHTDLNTVTITHGASVLGAAYCL